MAFLDENGLAHLLTKLKAAFAAKGGAAGTLYDAEQAISDVAAMVGAVDVSADGTVAAQLEHMHYTRNVNSDGNVSCASGTSTVLCSVTLAAGSYLIVGTSAHQTSAKGVRKLYVGTGTEYQNTRGYAATNAASDDGQTLTQVTAYVTCAEKTAYNLVSWQDSGSALNATGQLRAVRLV